MEDIISLEQVSKQLGRREILRDVTFAVKKGDIFGYLGPNGAGKTTSIRVMLGMFTPDKGMAKVLGQNPQIDKLRDKVGFVLETDGLYDNLSAYHNLRYYGQIYNVQQINEQIDKVVGIVGLSDRIKDKVGTYSKGMRQRLALARAIMHDPEVLILDEPTSGVDPTGQVEIREIMLNMVRKQGKTILLSSHNLDEVQRICNRVALIHKGQIRLNGELEQFKRQMSSGEVVIETAQPLSPSVLADLQQLPGIGIKSRLERKIVLTVGQAAVVSTIVSWLASRGTGIEQVIKKQASLEEIYTTIVKEAEQK